MNILIATNGHFARPEVSALATALNKNHKVTIASMSRDGGHQALSFSTSGFPTRVEQFPYKEAMRGKVAKLDAFNGIMVHEFYSRPADAISIMLGEIMKHDKPDLVMCGISNGTNLGPDVYSSSHVGMAMQAAFFKVPSIVVATEHKSGGNSEVNLKSVVQFIEGNLEEFANLPLPPHTFLNINIPRVERYSALKGVKYTKMGKSGREIGFDEKTTPNGHKYYWTKFYCVGNIPSKDDDRSWFEAGYVSITPICYDATKGGML